MQIHPMFKTIILASQSPRRRELMGLLQIPFLVLPPSYQEITQPHLSPEEEARFLAIGKAKSLQSEFPDALILGCDTLVTLRDQKLGKPANSTEALEMLFALSGRSHRVLTGMALLDPSKGRVEEALVETEVRMKPYSPKEARDYFKLGESMGKAGAYAIQGRGKALVESIHGDYFNVVGLPLRDLIHLFVEQGVTMPVSAEEIYRKIPKF